MQDETPVLLLGYNRPDQMRGLIQSLAAVKPKLILLSVDGPKINRSRDIELVRHTQQMVNEISWEADVRTRFRESNLGLRKAVVDAVTWANSEYGRVIVLEDDVRAGPQLLDFLNFNLIKFEKQNKIAHINGYNLVPVDYISKPADASRLSIYPESYAWSTWDRAWAKYDDNMKWAKDASIKEIKSLVGTTEGAVRWKQNFSDADNERIDTWAYRWLASMWEHRLLTISPNRNISSYFGSDNGTHTRRRVKWSELNVEFIEISKSNDELDVKADRWLQKVIFKEKISGVLEGFLVSFVLHVVQKIIHLKKNY